MHRSFRRFIRSHVCVQTRFFRRKRVANQPLRIKWSDSASSCRRQQRGRMEGPHGSAWDIPNEKNRKKRETRRICASARADTLGHSLTPCHHHHHHHHHSINDGISKKTDGNRTRKSSLFRPLPGNSSTEWSCVTCVKCAGMPSWRAWMLLQNTAVMFFTNVPFPVLTRACF